MKVLLLLSLLFVGVNAQAQECISKEEITEIATHFTQFRNLSGKEYCYTDTHESHLIAGLMFMRKTQFDPMEKSKDDLFSGRFANGWYNYFIGRITDMEIDENCPKGVAAYVYAFGGKTMYVCTMMLTSNYTALDRASVFMHEARHIDGYPHITCRRGARAGLQGACDNRIADGGSYAVSVETYAQLAKFATGIHPALKAYAKSSAVVYADEAFESQVRIERVQQFVVMDSNRNFHLVRADGSSQVLGQTPMLGKIVMRGQHMTLIPDNVQEKARFVFARNEGEINQEAGELAADYNTQTPEQRANLVDFHIATQWNARIYQDKAVFACDPRSKQTKELSIKGDAPVGMIYPNGYDRAATGAQLMMQSGKVYDIGCSNKSTPVLAPSAISLDQKYKSMYKVGELTLGITMNGELREVQGTSSRPFGVKGLGTVHEIAPNQTVDFFGF
jgi:hypothetical protein